MHSSTLKPFKLQLNKNGQATLYFRSSELLTTDTNRILQLPISNAHLTTAIQSLSVRVLSSQNNNNNNNSTNNDEHKSTVTYTPQPPTDSRLKPLWRRVLGGVSSRATVSVTGSLQHGAQRGILLNVNEDEDDGVHQKFKKGCIILEDEDSNMMTISCFESGNPPPIHIETETDVEFELQESNTLKEGYQNVNICVSSNLMNINDKIVVEASYSFSFTNHDHMKSPIDFVYKIDASHYDSDFNRITNDPCKSFHDAWITCFAIIACPTSFILENIQVEIIVDENRKTFDDHFNHTYNTTQDNNINGNNSPTTIASSSSSSLSISPSGNKGVVMNKNWFQSLKKKRYSMHDSEEQPVVCKQAITYKYEHKVTMYPGQSLKVELYHRKPIGFRQSFSYLHYGGFYNVHAYPTIQLQNTCIDNIENGPCVIENKKETFIHNCIKDDFFVDLNIADQSSIICETVCETHQNISLSMNIVERTKQLCIRQYVERTVILEVHNRDHNKKAIIDIFTYININSDDNGRKHAKCIAFESWDDYNNDNIVNLPLYSFNHIPIHYVYHSVNERCLFQFTEQVTNERYVSLTCSSQVTYKRIHSHDDNDELRELLRLNRQMTTLKRKKKRIKRKMNSIREQKQKLMKSNQGGRLLFHLLFKQMKSRSESCADVDCMNQKIGTVISGIEKGFSSCLAKLKHAVECIQHKIIQVKSEKDQLLGRLCGHGPPE